VGGLLGGLSMSLQSEKDLFSGTGYGIVVAGLDLALLQIACGGLELHTIMLFVW